MLKLFRSWWVAFRGTLALCALSALAFWLSVSLQRCYRCSRWMWVTHSHYCQQCLDEWAEADRAQEELDEQEAKRENAILDRGTLAIAVSIPIGRVVDRWFDDNPWSVWNVELTDRSDLKVKLITAVCDFIQSR